MGGGGAVDVHSASASDVQQLVAANNLYNNLLLNSQNLQTLQNLAALQNLQSVPGQQANLPGSISSGGFGSVAGPNLGVQATPNMFGLPQPSFSSLKEAGQVSNETLQSLSSQEQTLTLLQQAAMAGVNQALANSTAQQQRMLSSIPGSLSNLQLPPLGHVQPGIQTGPQNLFPAGPQSGANRDSGHVISALSQALSSAAPQNLMGGMHGVNPALHSLNPVGSDPAGLLVSKIVPGFECCSMEVMLSVLDDRWLYLDWRWLCNLLTRAKLVKFGSGPAWRFLTCALLV